MSEIAFVVVTKDRPGPVKVCLRSIAAQERPASEVVVVDDASIPAISPESMEELRDVTLVSLNASLGAAGARNAGLDLVTADIVVLLDDDAFLPDKNATGLIMEKFEARPEVGALCFRVETPEGEVRRKEVPRRDKRLPVNEEEIGYFLEGAVAFRASALAAVGGFPEDYVYGGIGLDLSYRLFSAGYPMLFAPEVRVVHLSLPSAGNTENRDYLYLRNRIWAAARNLPFPYAQVNVALWAAHTFAGSLTSGRRGGAWRGLRDGLERWDELRSEGPRLSRRMTRRLSALSGRTWW